MFWSSLTRVITGILKITLHSYRRRWELHELTQTVYSKYSQAKLPFCRLFRRQRSDNRVKIQGWIEKEIAINHEVHILVVFSSFIKLKYFMIIEELEFPCMFLQRVEVYIWCQNTDSHPFFKYKLGEFPQISFNNENILVRYFLNSPDLYVWFCIDIIIDIINTDQYCDQTIRYNPEHIKAILFHIALV